MKRFYIILGLALLLFTACSSNKGEVKENPYKLEIIATTDAYLESVKQDSTNILIDLEKYIPGIVLDIRYADTNNFTKSKIYTLPKAYLRKPAADSLLKIQKILAGKGLGLKVYDAYRPYAATLYFYKVYPDTTFVAAPWKGSIHNRGCAVDLSIIDLKTGTELKMPTTFDSFTDQASHNCMEIDSTAMANRSLLKEVMLSHGFTLYDAEWWHYNLKQRDNYKLMNLSFEELEAINNK